MYLKIPNEKTKMGHAPYARVVHSLMYASHDVYMSWYLLRSWVSKQVLIEFWYCLLESSEVDPFDTFETK